MNTLATGPLSMLGLSALMLMASAVAQEGPRDPMQPPPAMRAPAPAVGQSPAEPPAVVARHLMVIDGVRYVIDNGRRRGVGDLLGGGRIERIEDSAIVLRNGKQLQRLPLFAGVVKRPVAEPLPSGSPSPANPGGVNTGARRTDTTLQTAQARAACADGPSCTQRPGEPR